MHFISVAIGLLGMAVFTFLDAFKSTRNMVGMSGMVYMLMGPAHGMHGPRYAKARAKLIESRQSAAS